MLPENGDEMKNLKLFIPLAIFIVLAVFLLKGLDKDPNALPSALIDKPVPAFVLPDLHDSTETVDETVFKNEVTLLNVWATWCMACRVEHPYLMELANQGVRIVSMNYKDDTETALQWLKDKGDPYIKTFEDKEGRLGIDLGVFGAPETYLVDHLGIIRAKHVGVLDERVWGEWSGLYRSLLDKAPVKAPMKESKG